MADTNVISTDIKKMVANTARTVQLVKVLNYYGIKKPIDIAVNMLKPKIDEILRFIS